MNLEQDIIDKLEEPLDPSLVAHREGGRGMQLAYLEGYVVIEQANRIFGYGNWAHRAVSVAPVRGANGEPLGCEATVEFWLFGEHISTDQGFTPFISSVVNADMYDMACKGAVTDGMKRAMRMMGAQFGNSLYGGESAPTQQAPSPTPPKQPWAPVPAGTPTQASDTVCKCGKNKRSGYEVCFECNQKRKVAQYEPSQPSPTQETGQPPPPPDYDPQDQTGGW